ncbi:maestro heat-like repeat-containing protein family member 1 [Rhea pennata]|uniref:maestro heat-like repeat-containing protein family member 1 n=1 Tax=Rhea pennata TaxID=8795 RepID=UPI002E265FF7
METLTARPVETQIPERHDTHLRPLGLHSTEAVGPIDDGILGDHLADAPAVSSATPGRPRGRPLPPYRWSRPRGSRSPRTPRRPARSSRCGDTRVTARLLTPQALLARLLVVAAAPHTSGGCGIAALRLLQALSTEIHGAVGMVWAVKIPFLLEHLAERSESSLDSAEWEHLLLKFLRTSLETIESQAWTMAFSFELNQQAGSYCRLSREQAFLYKAVGVSLAACQHVPYVREEIRKYFFQTNYLEASEREAMISVVAGSAESHFPLALEVVHEFGATMEERPVSGAFRRLKEYHQGKRAGTHTALVLAYGRMALCAPREQLLARVESDVVGPILRHYRASCQVLGFTFSTKVSAAQRGLASCPSRTPSLLRACRTGAPQATGPGSSGGR